MTLYHATQFANAKKGIAEESLADILTGKTPSVIYGPQNYSEETVVAAFNYGKRDDEYNNLAQLCFSSPKMVVPFNGEVAPFAKDAKGKIVGQDISDRFNELERSQDTRVFYSTRPVDWIAHQLEQAGFVRYF